MHGRGALGYQVLSAKPSAALGWLLREAAQSSLLRRLHARAYGYYIANKGGRIRSFHGIYDDFAGATAAAPKSAEIGFDNQATALLLAESRHRIFPQDYPVLFWLARYLRRNTFLFDLGGNVGISYFGFERYLNYDPSMTWLVHDVAAVVEAGEAIAERERAEALRFTTDYAEIAQADIFLAAGVLQYLADPMAPLRAARKLPKHVIINTTPVYDKESRVTLQAIGTAYCPYHLFNRAGFIKGFTDLGYSQIDAWRCPAVGCFIPSDPDYRIPELSGFCFALNDDRAG
jgi:putative methyltransferase (TIGR04325 family)